MSRHTSATYREARKVINSIRWGSGRSFGGLRQAPRKGDLERFTRWAEGFQHDEDEAWVTSHKCILPNSEAERMDLNVTRTYISDDDARSAGYRMGTAQRWSDWNDYLVEAYLRPDQIQLMAALGTEGRTYLDKAEQGEFDIEVAS